jgi:hypothetical protein
MLPRQLLPRDICSRGPDQAPIKTETHSLSRPHPHLHRQPHLRLHPHSDSRLHPQLFGEQVSLGSKCPGSNSRVTTLRNSVDCSKFRQVSAHSDKFILRFIKVHHELSGSTMPLLVSPKSILALLLKSSIGDYAIVEFLIILVLFFITNSCMIW